MLEFAFTFYSSVHCECFLRNRLVLPFYSLPLHITPETRMKQKHHKALPTSTSSRVGLQSAAEDRHLFYFLHMLQITTQVCKVIMKMCD